MPFETYKRNVKLGKGQALGFRKGKGYYARPAARPKRPTARPTPDPYRPWTEDEIMGHARQDVLPGYTSAAAALTEALLGRATRTSNEITARNRAISGALAPYEQSARSIYGDAQGRQQALGDAVRGAITGTGQAIQADLGQRLTGIQAPQQAVDQFAGGAARTGEGAAQAAGALSSADLERLRGEGGAAAAYAGALPRIAGLAAEGQRRSVLSEAAQTLTEKLAGLYADQPNAIAERADYYHKLELQKAQDRYERAQDAIKRRDALRKQADLNAYRSGQLGLSAGRLQQGQVRLDQGQQRIGLSAQSLALRQLSADRSWQATLHRLGIADANLALRTAQAQTKLNTGGITPAGVKQLQKRAGQVASRAWNGVNAGKDEDGVQLKEYMSYQEAMREGLAAGIPLTMMQHALNSYWTRPGQHTPRDPKGQGRPKLSYQERHPKAGAAANGGSVFTPPTSWAGTHVTDNLDWNQGRRTAEDIMLAAGTIVGAPDSGQILRYGSAQGGASLYFDDDDPDLMPDYWLGHIESIGVRPGQRVRRGQPIARISARHPRPHLHIDRKL